MSSLVLNMVGGAAAGNKVYSGTINYDITASMPDTITIDTGVQISEDAVFLFLPWNVYNPYNNYEFFAAGRINKNFRFVENSAPDSGAGYSYLQSSVDQSSNLFVNYSGSVVTISCSGIPLADAGLYAWYLIQ